MSLTKSRRYRWLLAAITVATLLLNGCSSTADRDAHEPVDALGEPGLRQQLIDTAINQIGRPYRYGGNTRRGFDCSGLVQYSHEQVGVSVPRTTAGQWRAGRPVQASRLQPGDLLFFTIGPQKSRHVGIYEGRDSFIHAPSSGKRVSRASLSNPYWQSRLVGGRSFL
ncbi:MAG: C40 family peptidase [Gammaproteobacteria bacterium]|nr:C40 family peptidase [Gammaproteobacteria bacterium]